MNGKTYEILSPTKIRLGPEAKDWAKEHGMTLQEMARYLLAQNQDVESNAEETPAAEEAEDILPHVTPSENIEDRRDEPIYGPGLMRQVWGELPHDVAPQAQ